MVASKPCKRKRMFRSYGQRLETAFPNAGREIGRFSLQFAKDYFDDGFPQ
jgi:hypothetical protein